MASMQEIARRAGVSTATVSYVLNHRVRKGSSISEATTRRVLDIAEELGYQRNELAHAIKTGKNRMIGLLLANRTERQAEFLGRIMYGVLDEAEEHDFTVKIFRFRDGEIERTIERCASLRLAGLCVIGGGDSAVRQLRESRLTQNSPLAVFSYQTQLRDGVLYVTSDDEHCYDEVIAHLHAQGHRRIAYIGGQTHHHESAAREAAFRQAMAAHNLAVPQGFSEFCDWHTERVAQLLDQWLGADQPPTAVLCPSDYMAMVALRRAHERGLAVPAQLAVVGFGGMSIAELTHPPLTTVARPFEEMGRAAVRLLLEHETPVSAHLTLPTQLVVRESTGAAVSFVISTAAD